MKVGIIIPLKSKELSKNWQVTCEALKKTLKSVLSQSDERYEVVVVGHECPSFINELKRNNLDVFYKVDGFPPPLQNGGSEFHQHKVLDKNKKIVTGIKYLKENCDQIRYWFPLDADDLIHKDFVQNIVSSNLSAGAIFEKGYIYYQNKKRMIKTDEFHLYCGSSALISDEYINCPSKINSESIRQVPFCRYAHFNMSKYFENDIKRDYKKIDIRLLAYVVSHGDNISDIWKNSLLKKTKHFLKPYIIGKKLDQDFINNFLH